MLIMAKNKAEQVKVDELEVGTAELAVIIGKSDRWIRKITAEGILKQVSRGKYNLANAVQSYIEHAEGGKEQDNKPRLIDHKTEHERIKSEMAALELAEMQGKLHKAEDVEAVMNDMLSAFRQRSRAIPTRLAPDLVGEDNIQVIKGKLSDAIDEALFELSNYDPEKFNDEARNDVDDG